MSESISSLTSTVISLLHFFNSVAASVVILVGCKSVASVQIFNSIFLIIIILSEWDFC